MDLPAQRQALPDLPAPLIVLLIGSGAGSGDFALEMVRISDLEAPVRVSPSLEAPVRVSLSMVTPNVRFGRLRLMMEAHVHLLLQEPLIIVAGPNHAVRFVFRRSKSYTDGAPAKNHRAITGSVMAHPNDESAANGTMGFP